MLARPSQNSAYTAAGLRGLSVDLVRCLADLHAVDPADVGLADFGRPDGYLARQLSTWRRQLDASRSRDTPALDALQDSLAEGMPHSSRTGIVHGDFRLDNALVVGEGDEPRISAILDWEMATLGDPFVDLGIFALYWDIAEPPGRIRRRGSERRRPRRRLPDASTSSSRSTRSAPGSASRICTGTAPSRRTSSR